MLFALIDTYALGRLDYATMSQQALMENVVSQIDKSKLCCFCDRNGNFRDYREWPGVLCDAEGNVGTIFWKSFADGTILLHWLPETIRILSVRADSLKKLDVEFGALPRDVRIFKLDAIHVSNEVSFDALPQNIQEIIMLSTDARGVIRLGAIPQTLRTIQVNGHALSSIDLKCNSSGLTDLEVTAGTLQGSLDFRGSPQSLKKLNLELNSLQGTLSFEGARESLERILLRRNKFQGTLRLEFLPKALIELNLTQNSFITVLLEKPLPDTLVALFLQPSYNVYTEKTGRFHFMYIGDSMRNVNISRSNVKGIVQFRNVEKLEKVHASDNLLEGSLNTQELPSNLQFLNMANNELKGSLDLTALPPRMVLLNVSRNAFSGTINLNHLPQRMQLVHLSDNQLCGKFTINYLPHTLSEISLTNNRFEMDKLAISIDCQKMPKIDLRGNTVEKIVNENGEKVVVEKVIL